MAYGEDKKRIQFQCLRVRQPIGEFFVGAMSAEDVCNISHFDVRRVLQEERDVERYLGIQRPLNPKRVEALKQYVNYYDATFPTSIILAVDQKCAEFDEDTSTMTLENFLSEDQEEEVLFRNIARVIDGQHRIAGLYEFKGESFDVNVTLFVGIDIADQAQIFSTVNLEQTKVSKSLAYDLFALAQSRSPQKTCHNVAVALDQDETSPFYKRIKRLGFVTPDRTGETLTQATFVEAVMKYITRKPREDRDILLRGRRLPALTEDDLRNRPLRKFFVEERDFEIVELLWNYFEAVRQRWPKAWDYTGRGLMLNKTNGFRGLMRVFGDAYLHFARPGEMVKMEQFRKLFERVEIEDDEFNTENYVPGSSGESHLAHDLRRHMKIGD